jgi:hypothetical protein
LAVREGEGGFALTIKLHNIEKGTAIPFFVV